MRKKEQTIIDKIIKGEDEQRQCSWHQKDPHLQDYTKWFGELWTKCWNSKKTYLFIEHTSCPLLGESLEA